jgi:hypothetical protein
VVNIVYLVKLSELNVCRVKHWLSSYIYRLSKQIIKPNNYVKCGMFILDSPCYTELSSASALALRHSD